MLIIGLNGSANLVHENRFNIGESNYHDAGAALIHHGDLVAVFEEERLNRIKHTNKLPVLSLQACLNTRGVKAREIDYFAFGFSERVLEEALSGAAEAAGSIVSGRHFLQQTLEEQLQEPIDANKIIFFEHHYVHAVTAFYPSPFDRALVLTIDGSGGEYAGSIYDGNENGLQLVQTFSTDQSLGHFYAAVTHLLGFGHFDEYKVMGLAPYGDPQKYEALFKAFYKLLPGGNYELYIDRAELLRSLLPQAGKTEKFSQQHMDIAASLQAMTEKIVLHVAAWYRQALNHTNLCIAGGVGLNCTMNGKLLNAGLFEDVFVFPGAGDSGLAIGSALAAWTAFGDRSVRKPLKDLYLGTGIGNDHAIRQSLDAWQQWITYEKLDNAPLQAAQLLAADKVIGWVQGQAEFAPRALGNRSILADARPAKNKERINFMVKKREGFRPFAPSVLEEAAAEYFELPPHQHRFPYMMFILNVQEKYREYLGAITHVDGTARIQTVSREDNPAYWQLIKHFGDITGTPVILNTSFNNNCEPIVDTAEDSIVCFLTTQLDYLVIGDYLVAKQPFQLANLDGLYCSPAPYTVIRQQGMQYRIANTFNDKVLDISASVFALLEKEGDASPVGNLLTDMELGSSERQAVGNELMRLWEKRVIILSPVPITSRRPAKQAAIPA